MKLSQIVRMIRADDEATLVTPDHPTQQPDFLHPEDLTGPNPHPTDYKNQEQPKEHGDWVLVEEEGHKALVVDRGQNYIIVTKTGQQWHEGPARNLGPIGREQALREFEQESDEANS